MTINEVFRLLEDTLEEVLVSEYQTMSESVRIDQIQTIIDRLKKKIIDLNSDKRKIQQSEKRDKERLRQSDRRRRDSERKKRESERKQKELERKRSQKK